MKSVARVFRLLPAALLACALAVSGAAFAGEVSGDPAPAEPLYVVNPEAEPLSREETLSMAEEAAEAFYNRPVEPVRTIQTDRYAHIDA